MEEDDDFRQPAKRIGHIAAIYGDYMLVWGGYKEIPAIENSSQYLNTSHLWMYNPFTELWKLKETVGDVPSGISGAAAVVIDNYLYIFGGYQEDGSTNRLYRLNLQTFVWQFVQCNGALPIASDKLVGWSYNKNLYLFGGFGLEPNFGIRAASDFRFVLDHTTPLQYRRGWNNQFVMFNPEKSEWTWPKYKGSAPVARAAHAVTKIDNKIYLFGGRHQYFRMNDLHCFDMSTMTWSGAISTCGVKPRGRSWHSFTAISEEYIILYGGFSQSCEPLNDCWRFHIPTNTWQNIVINFKKPRLWHTACLDCYNEVVIYGGCTQNILGTITETNHAEIITLRFSPKSLYRQCIDAVLSQNAIFQNMWSVLPQHIQAILVRKAVSKHSSLDGS